MAVIDIFLYNGEKEMLDLHLNILSPFVDKFIVLEAKTTFSGNKKPLYFSIHEPHFKKFWRKIEYFIINENYSPNEIRMAYESPNTKGAWHWQNEFLQKESIHKALDEYGAKDDDVIYIGDVDEIWEPIDPLCPTKLKLKVYAYYLNNRSDEEFWGTLVSRYSDLKGKCLNHLRSDVSLRNDEYKGWHFTSMGGLQEVRRKLNDSYTIESYNTYDVQYLLPERHKRGLDYLGRNFNFKRDESEWPEYLKANKNKYKHLLYEENNH